MSRTIHSFKSFEEALLHEQKEAASRTPLERMLLLHKLIAAWMKFPRNEFQSDDIPVIKRMKRNA